ncbi:MAG: PAS domain S-box protein [Alphaproteobacteria bacterium]
MNDNNRDAAVLQDAREKAALLTSIADFSDDAIGSSLLDGTILSWNRGAEQIYGYTATEIIGRNASLFFPEEVREEEGRLVAQLAAGLVVDRFETVRLRKDGTKFDACVTSSPMRDAKGNIIGLFRMIRDISAQKRAEQEIANNSLRLKVMIDSTLDGLITIDDKGIIQTLNSSAERMFGFTREQAVGLSFDVLAPDAFRTANNGHSSIDLKAGEVKIVGVGREVTGKRKGGTVFPMDLTVTAFRVADDSGFVAIVRDITARKMVEDNSALLLASIVASSDDAIISKGLNGQITSWNGGAERIFGFAARQAIGQPIQIIIPPDKVEEEADILARMNRGEVLQHFETVRKTASGERLAVEISASPVRDGAGNLIGSSKIIRDVTERNLAEAEQIRTATRLRAVLENAADGLITIDSHGVVESFNPACERIFGYKSEEAIGQNVNILMPEPYRSEHDGYIARYIKEGKPRVLCTSGREVSGSRKDGSVFPMDLSVAVFELGDGKHYSGIVRDITERKAVEAERERIAAELARYTRALEHSNLELDAFAFAASHDLKAPLRVIHNASKWIEEDLAENLTGEVRENMTLLRSRVQRMDKLLDDLLAYSRIGRETDDRQAEEISGAALMENIHGLIAPPEGFIVDSCITLAGIQVFRMPLQQILINLISNAIKHHDKKEGRIEISVEDLGAKFRFSVKDDGPGIPVEYHEKIFKMFQTLKPRDQVEGSGMGLALVRKHVEMAGGEVKLKSAIGQGSTFTFTWPKDNGILHKMKREFKQIGEAS